MATWSLGGLLCTLVNEHLQPSLKIFTARPKIYWASVGHTLTHIEWVGAVQTQGASWRDLPRCWSTWHGMAWHGRTGQKRHWQGQSHNGSAVLHTISDSSCEGPVHTQDIKCCSSQYRYCSRPSLRSHQHQTCSDEKSKRLRGVIAISDWRDGHARLVPT